MTASEPVARPTPPNPTTRTAQSSADKNAGNSYGSAASAFSEGALLVPLSGPKSADDTTRDESGSSGDLTQRGEPTGISVPASERN